MLTIREFLLISIPISIVPAQPVQPVHWRGTLETGLSLTDVSLELRPVGPSMDSYATVPGLNGQFDFFQVTPGNYVLAIKNQNGQL